MKVRDGEGRIDPVETLADGLDEGDEFGDVGEGLGVKIEEFADVVHYTDGFLGGFHRNGEEVGALENSEPFRYRLSDQLRRIDEWHGVEKLR